MAYERPQARVLLSRLKEKRRFIQALVGPRQTGKTTVAEQVAKQLKIPVTFCSADEPALQDSQWLQTQWDLARHQAALKTRSLLVVDEIQKIHQWSGVVKRLWDEDSRQHRNLKVVLLGSSPLLIQKGLSESLAGRFEIIDIPHWSLVELRKAFGLSVDEYIFYGAYPGAAPLRNDLPRWIKYINDALIETTVARDVLLMTRVDKPALLRQLFKLACQYSGQILSYQKMLGQLQDAGNTTTLAHYLDLLNAAGMVTGLQKYSAEAVRTRGSSPKLQVQNTALMSAASNQTLLNIKKNPALWGRWAESAVGAHILNSARSQGMEVYYWNDRHYEVDFVIRWGQRLLAIEVKSGRQRESLSGLGLFADRYPDVRSLLVGTGGIPIEEFLLEPFDRWR